MENTKSLYHIERLREELSEEELNKYASEIKSDEDCINFHLNNLDLPKNKKVVLINDEPIDEKAYLELKPEDADIFLNKYLDEGKANSKPKEVMRMGYSKQSKELYDKIVYQENTETKYINELTQPSFEDIYNNIYFNGYNGDIYDNSNDDIPDELREDVGVFIPGLIENQSQYFSFIKRLKDRGEGGLGRSIYDKYEDYLEATELIGKYIEAVYDKYGSKEDYYAAKDIGGMFGGYEYMPTVKPRFKKSKRNMKLAKGDISPVEVLENRGELLRLDSIRRDRERNIQYCDDEEGVMEISEIPPRFEDLPEELERIYATGMDKKIKEFKTPREYASKLIKSSDTDDIRKGKEMLINMEAEDIFYAENYESKFISDLDFEAKGESIDNIIDQLGWDKMVYQYGAEETSKYYESDNLKESYRNFMKDYYLQVNDCDESDVIKLSEADEYADYQTKYMYDPRFKEIEDEKTHVSSSSHDILKREKTLVLGEEERESRNANDSEIEAYLKELSELTRDSMDFLISNADTDDYAKRDGAYKTSLATDYRSNTITKGIDIDTDRIFTIGSSPDELISYIDDDIDLAKRIFAFTTDHPEDADIMFSDRCNIDDFVNLASKPVKPIITDNLITEIKSRNKRKGLKNGN